METGRRPGSLEVLRNHAPDVAQSFVAMRTAIEAAGPLDAKTRALIICGGFAATSNAAGLRSWCRRAIEAGAGRDELVQTVLLALGFTQGIAPVAEALSWVDDAFADTKHAD
jgi:alkylhydroperoxidase/carboxymuconolactone decarboxylase family protein YurZ